MITKNSDTGANPSKILVDTCVWSLSLRRHHDTSNNPIVITLTHLIQQQRAVMLDAIRQELLSGVHSSQQFESLRTQLRQFEDFPLTTEDYEQAAEFFNRCRAKGVQGSPTDFLLCAVAYRHQFAIFTTDKGITRNKLSNLSRRRPCYFDKPFTQTG